VALLEVRDLSVCVDGKKVVSGVSLSVDEGEVHVIMGPNGSGKSTLLSCVMGLPRAKPCGGRIFFNGVDVTEAPAHERASMGLALAHQTPPSIRGVKFSEVGKALIKKCGCSDYTLVAKMLNVESLLDRDLFVGFSGGEKKRAELFLVMLQSPKLAMLDEPDSGVDIESLDVIANAINYLSRRGTAMLLVTHSGAILNKLARLDYAHLLVDGKIVLTGRPDEIVPVIFKYGYRKGLEVLLSRRG